MLNYLSIVVFFAFIHYNQPARGGDAFQESKTIKDSTLPCIEEIEAPYWDTIPCGDLNGDKINDTAFVYNPAIVKCIDNKGDFQFYLECVDNNCYNKIKFSCRLPAIEFNNSVWGYVENIGDLNQDGYAELLFAPGQFIGCHGKLLLYTFEGKQWYLNNEVSYNSCSSDPIRSHLVKKKNSYYLTGTKLIKIDEKAYKVKIKFD